MKALTLWQPWASYVAIGAKRYETRSWSTGYRGPLVIHASKRPLGPEERRLLSRYPLPYGSKEMPFGAIVARCNLVDCLPMTAATIAAVEEQERALGDWRVGRFAWVLLDVEPIGPISTAGHQGLWEWER